MSFPLRAITLLFLTSLVVGTPAVAGGKQLVGSGTALDQSGQLVQMLASYSDRYWARVAGRDTGLPPHVNGHDEFLAAWTQQMLADLHGLPARVVRQRFDTPGFIGLPAKRPGVNVLVVVPGAKHADQAVVVGAHPDGEPSSKGSAYDDTSGSIILLGLARALGEEWRAHGPPALTVEFVLFDAEEEGLVGSGFYTFAYRHGAVMPRPVFMIDEEQSGVEYPVRPFGLLSQDPLPSYAITTGSIPPRAARIFGKLAPPDKAALALETRRITAARSTVFAQLHALYPSLQYRGGEGAVFTPGDEHLLQIGPIPLCCSDNDPFEALGLPVVTFAGNSDYYSPGAQPWAYPYDQPEDTITSLACDTGGAPQPGPALEAALELPLGLTRVLVGDYAPATPPGRSAGQEPAILSTVPGPGAAMQFNAAGAQPVTWDFGDGAHAAGQAVTHVYHHAGSYTLTLRAGSTTRRVSVVVPRSSPIYASPLNVRPPPRRPWNPVALQTVAGCHA